jgi:hypothetical protein
LDSKISKRFPTKYLEVFSLFINSYETLAQKKSELKMFSIFDMAFFQLPVNDAEKKLTMSDVVCGQRYKLLFFGVGQQFDGNY